MNFNPKCQICNNDVKCMYEHTYYCGSHYYISNKRNSFTDKEFANKWEMIFIYNEYLYLYVNDAEEKYFFNLGIYKETPLWFQHQANIIALFINGVLSKSTYYISIKLENINSITEAIEYIKALALFT